jgi:hypothetical protein
MEAIPFVPEETISYVIPRFFITDYLYFSSPYQTEKPNYPASCADREKTVKVAFESGILHKIIQPSTFPEQCYYGEKDEGSQAPSKTAGLNKQLYTLKLFYRSVFQYYHN